MSVGKPSTISSVTTGLWHEINYVMHDLADADYNMQGIVQTRILRIFLQVHCFADRYNHIYYVNTILVYLSMKNCYLCDKPFDSSLKTYDKRKCNKCCHVCAALYTISCYRLSIQVPKQKLALKNLIQ